jgi:hypothetical protein
MASTAWGLGAGLVAVASLMACGGAIATPLGDGGPGSSGGSGGGSGGGSAVDSCLVSSSSDACLTCIESQCGSQLTTFESGCNDYIACVCMSGTFSEAAAESETCQEKAEEVSCQSGEQNLAPCLEQNCEGQCVTTTMGSSSGPSGSSGGTGTSSGSGSGSSSGGGGTTTIGCIYDGTAGTQCTLYTNLTPSQQEGLSQECNQQMGTTVTACPTSNEVGCCAYATNGFETTACYYCGSGSQLESACMSSQSGSWMAGPGGPATCP